MQKITIFKTENNCFRDDIRQQKKSIFKNGKMDLGDGWTLLGIVNGNRYKNIYWKILKNYLTNK
jgi:hypothetical protein